MTSWRRDSAFISMSETIQQFPVCDCGLCLPGRGINIVPILTFFGPIAIYCIFIDCLFCFAVIFFVASYLNKITSARGCDWKSGIVQYRLFSPARLKGNLCRGGINRSGWHSFTNCRLPAGAPLTILIAHEYPDGSGSSKKQATESHRASGGCLFCHADLPDSAGEYPA